MDDKIIREFTDKISDSASTVRYLAAVRGGNNTVFHNLVTEAVTLDDSWIITVENALYSVENIVRNPRRFIADEELVVDVERARRTNAKTVRHLAVNTKNIREISADGSVTPKKVLTTEMREELAIYENRVVCSLISRVETFVEQRYRDLEDKMKVRDVTTAGMRSNMTYGESEFDVNVTLTVKEPPRDKILLERNRALLFRVGELRKRIRSIRNTKFMKELSKAKPVHPPIMKTNLLKMNVDYSNCYKLWLYISSYTFVGYSIEVKDKSLPVSGEYYDDLTAVAAMSIQSLMVDSILNGCEYDSVPFNEPKEKKFRISTDYKIVPNFRADDKKPDDDSINEYYFRQLKAAVTKASKREVSGDPKTLAVNFNRFVRTLQKLNDELFGEVIRSEDKGKDLTRKTALQKKEAAVKNQKTLLARYRQLSKLKREDLEKSLKAESRALLKLEKLTESLDAEKGRLKRKRETARQKQARAKQIEEAKKAIVETHAKQYEQELRDREAERQEEIRLEKERKREETKRRRELKKLEQLKEKYESENE